MSMCFCHLHRHSSGDPSSTRLEYTQIDPWADMIVSDAAHASNARYASHNAFVLMEKATIRGIATAAELRRVPIAR